jgi:hypothetical protein
LPKVKPDGNTGFGHFMVWWPIGLFLFESLLSSTARLPKNINWFESSYGDAACFALLAAKMFVLTLGEWL